MLETTALMMKTNENEEKWNLSLNKIHDFQQFGNTFKNLSRNILKSLANLEDNVKSLMNKLKNKNRRKTNPELKARLVILNFCKIFIHHLFMSKKQKRNY